MHKTTKYFKILAFLLFIPMITWAQTQISGKIIDDKGVVIPFATVIEDGTSNGTTTDENGIFSFATSKFPTTLVASFIISIVTPTASLKRGIMLMLCVALFGSITFIL